MHDLVVRNGTIADGTGGPLRTGDIAIDEGRISMVGKIASTGREEIDASDRVVAPGFIDPHTHYDGQATWDPLLTPSVWHGVTTVVMGNCGVGFAPVSAERRDFLIGLMEGVEDIPGSALAEGIRWEWGSVPKYLDALERFPRAIDIAAQVTHGSVRAHVMGERGAANEPATSKDLVQMAAIVEEAVAAGAIGFSTNRLALHTAIDGRPVPGTFASTDELMALAGAARAGAGGGNVVLQAITAASIGNDNVWSEEIALLARLSRSSGLPCTFTFGQTRADPERWRELLHEIERHNEQGAQLVPQVACRPLGILAGLRTKHAWQGRPTYEALAHLDVEARAHRLADPQVKASILSEKPVTEQPPMVEWLQTMTDAVFPLGDPPDYEPPPERSLRALAAKAGRDPNDLMYDLMLGNGGRDFLLFTLDGYAYSNMDHTLELLERRDTVLGLGDGGAHVSLICDGSYPSVMLAHWSRDRARGRRLPLEWSVRKMTSEPAELFGMSDRGRLEPGLRGDLNVLDVDELAVGMPEILNDLPGGAPRLVQRARGIDATVVAGKVIQRAGEDTGARPGRLLRGARF